MYGMLFGTIGTACVLLGAVTAVDAVDRIRDRDPFAIASVCCSVVLATVATGCLAIVLELLDTVR